MNNFSGSFIKKLKKTQYNNFGSENYDASRYGELKISDEELPGAILKIKRFIKKVIGYSNSNLNLHEEFLSYHGEGLQTVYENLNKNGQKLLVEIIAYRILGFQRVKISRNNRDYCRALATSNSLADISDTYDPHFLHYILKKFRLREIGYDLELYFFESGVAIDFILEQYAYKSGGKNVVSVEEGDVVLDLGACWGDSALYFAWKTQKKGKVYSFEFIPENIKLFDINLSLNPILKDQVELIRHPVSDKSGDSIYFIDNGPGSRIEFAPFQGQTGKGTTISVDDFVFKNGISKIDFIKMDIEGAETAALKGAIETIRKFKPKLAIAIYHSMEDLTKIPIWILDLNLGYKLYLDHFTIHSEETVIFAKVEK